MRLEDTNGPRGGVDKSCKVTLRLEHGKELTLESKDTTLVAAVDKALDRAGNAVTKAVGRAQRTGGREPPQRGVAADEGARAVVT